MIIRTAIAIIIVIIISSCQNQITDTFPDFTAVYSKNKLDSINCASGNTRVGSLGTIDFSNSDSLLIRFNYEVQNNLTSTLILYHTEYGQAVQIANIQLFDYEGSYYGEFIVRSPNAEKNVRYEMNLNAIGGNCYFAIKNFIISKN